MQKRYSGQIAFRFSPPQQLVLIETPRVAVTEVNIGVKGVVRRGIFDRVQVADQTAPADTEVVAQYVPIIGYVGNIFVEPAQFRPVNVYH